MKLSMLQKAILNCIKVSLAKSHDNFVRLDLPFAYPLKEVLEKVQEDERNLVVGLLTPYKVSHLSGTRLQLESKASELTKLRNTRRESNDPVVLLGAAIGPEESGLRDLAQIVFETDVIKEWEKSFHGALNALSNSHDLQLRIKIGSWFFDNLKRENFQPH